jgi:hypothetical protein
VKSKTDGDNQGKVTDASTIDRYNQASFSLIIKRFHHFSPNLCNSARDSLDQTVDRIKI